jgi:hypothetical protein
MQALIWASLFFEENQGFTAENAEHAEIKGRQQRVERGRFFEGSF